jgi:hypothetical protein
MLWRAVASHEKCWTRALPPTVGRSRRSVYQTPVEQSHSSHEVRRIVPHRLQPRAVMRPLPLSNIKVNSRAFLKCLIVEEVPIYG